MSDDKRLERIEAKIDDLDDNLHQINVTLSAQHESLKQHMSRTAQLEDEFRPIRAKVLMAQGAAAFISLVIASGIAYEIIKSFIK